MRRVLDTNMMAGEYKSSTENKNSWGGGGENIDRVRLQTYSSEKARVHRPFRHNLVNKRGRILFIMACATMEVTSDRTV